jgi:fructose-1,6-bisphosphatase I
VGDYAAVFDPLDGSSNVDSGLPTGTIFGVYKKPPFGASDPFTVVKQRGTNLVVGGYCLYGAATHLVVTMRSGLHQFTLDDVTGEFYLTKEGLQIPQNGPIYACNDANKDYWHHSIRNFIDDFKHNRLNTKEFSKLAKLSSKYPTVASGENDHHKEHETVAKASARYFGALVADAHNVLTSGGFYAYPATEQTPQVTYTRLLLFIWQFALSSSYPSG